MGCCSCLTAEIAACVLRIVNSLLMAVGVLLAVAGALLHYGGSGVYNIFSSLLGSISSGIGGDVQLRIDDLLMIMGNWTNVFGSVGFILLAVGLFLIALGILGWIGACCKLKIILVAYAGITALFSIIIAGGLLGYTLFRSNLHATGAEQMLKLVQEQYQGRSGDSQNDFSRILDLVQARLQCCGVTNFTNFYEASQWNRTYYLKEESRYITLVAPVSCCKLSRSTLQPEDVTCLYAPTPRTSNIYSSCYEQLWLAIDSVSGVFTMALGITAGVTGSISLLAIAMLCHHTNNDVTPI